MQKLKRQAVYGHFPGFPSYVYDEANDLDLISFPDTVRYDTLEVCDAVSASDRLARMAAAVRILAGVLSVEGFVFMGESARAWRKQRSLYPPAKRALEFLAAHRIGATFDGGIRLDALEIEEWLPRLMQIIICSASLPVIYFIDAKAQLLGTTCQYGNLHLYTLHGACTPLIDAFILQSRLRPVGKEGCRDHGDTLLEGRELITGS